MRLTFSFTVQLLHAAAEKARAEASNNARLEVERAARQVEEERRRVEQAERDAEEARKLQEQAAVHDAEQAAAVDPNAEGSGSDGATQVREKGFLQLTCGVLTGLVPLSRVIIVTGGSSVAGWMLLVVSGALDKLWPASCIP